MTATLPTESTDAAQASTLRPAWVTDARVASWLRWVCTSAGAGTASRAALAPYDALPTIAVPDSTVEDVAAAVDAARHAQAAWSALPYSARAGVMCSSGFMGRSRQKGLRGRLYATTPGAAL